MNLKFVVDICQLQRLTWSIIHWLSASSYSHHFPSNCFFFKKVALPRLCISMHRRSLHFTIAFRDFGEPIAHACTITTKLRNLTELRNNTRNASLRNFCQCMYDFDEAPKLDRIAKSLTMCFFCFCELSADAFIRDFSVNSLKYSVCLPKSRWLTSCEISTNSFLCHLEESKTPTKFHDRCPRHITLWHCFEVHRICELLDVFDEWHHYFPSSFRKKSQSSCSNYIAIFDFRALSSIAEHCSLLVVSNARQCSAMFDNARQSRIAT